MFIEVVLIKISFAIWMLSTIFTSIPAPKNNITIIYTLYTPDNPIPTIIENIDEINIDSNYELKVLCHGWYYPNYTTQWYNYTVEEYLKKGDVNIITADYSYAINNLKYYEAFQYTHHIGPRIGNFILSLNESKGIPLSKVHILGHLLGAHIAGVAGKTIYKESGKYIDRITAMDPINMLFMISDVDGQLHRNDANFVDVIHGSGTSYSSTIGRIEFFAYAYRANCYNLRERKPLGPVYYTNSINNVDVISGTKCLNKKHFSLKHCTNVSTNLGEYVDRAQFGQYILKASDVYKYVCKKQNIETTTTTETTE